MKIAIATLGCKVNQSESHSMEAMLRDNDYEIVDPTDNPDVCIVNTCTVTSKSDYQSRQLIRRAVKCGSKVIATGCYAQLSSTELSKIEGVDLIIGNSGKARIIKHLKKLLDDNNAKPLSLIDPSDNSLLFQPYYSTRSRAFLKIQDGCNFSCSYCAVPLARGKSRSLGTGDVLLSADRLRSEGYNEIVLTGIHIGSYGIDLVPQSSLSSIVDMLTNKYPQIRFRLSSIEPNEFKENFLIYIKREALCAHLHIPLQSGSDKILKDMNRSYSVSFYKSLIEKISSVCPDISIGTDIITGFPGENENDFAETLKLIEEMPISYLHVFPYSKRPDTRASLLKGQVADKVKQERVRTLLDLGKRKRDVYLRRNLGKVLDVIIERKDPHNNCYKAISDNYIRVLIDSNNLHSGQRIKARVISLTDTGLIAAPLLEI